MPTNLMHTQRAEPGHCCALRGLSAAGSRGRSTRSGSPTHTPGATTGRTGRGSRPSELRLDGDTATDGHLLEGAGFVLEGRLAHHAVYPTMGPEPQDSLLYAKVLR